MYRYQVSTGFDVIREELTTVRTEETKTPTVKTSKTASVRFPHGRPCICMGRPGIYVYLTGKGGGLIGRSFHCKPTPLPVRYAIYIQRVSYRGE